LDQVWKRSDFCFQANTGTGISGVIALVPIYLAETFTLVKINCSSVPRQGNGPGIAVDKFQAILKKFATNSLTSMGTKARGSQEPRSSSGRARS
jgi:hypothetical protein